MQHLLQVEALTSQMTGVAALTTNLQLRKDNKNTTDLVRPHALHGLVMNTVLHCIACIASNVDRQSVAHRELESPQTHAADMCPEISAKASIVQYC